MGQPKASTNEQRSKKSTGRSTPLKWIVVAGVLGLVGYGVSQMSNIAYGEAEITVVDFSGLDAKQKRSALEAANAARCACGCGMTLAQCVATDSTCPVREGNVDTIKGMVDQAARTKSGSGLLWLIRIGQEIEHRFRIILEYLHDGPASLDFYKQTFVSAHAICQRFQDTHDALNSLIAESSD